LIECRSGAGGLCKIAHNCDIFDEEPGVKASAQGFTLADLVRGRAVRACGHCGRETEVNVDAWSSSHPMHPNRNANRYHQKQRQRHGKINRIRIHLSTSLPVAGTKLT
jgi:hypothetical protein